MTTRANPPLVSLSIGATAAFLAAGTALAAPTDASGGAQPSSQSVPNAAPQAADTSHAQSPAPTPPAESAATLPSGAVPSAPASATPNPVGVQQPPRILVAQPESDKKCEPCDDRDAAEGAGAFMVGPGLFDFSSLNDRLQASGYETLPTMVTLIGGEGHAVFQNGFVAGARGAAVLAPSRSGPSGFEADFSGGFGMLDFGYAFVRTVPFLFTLTCGIGGYGIGLGIGDNQAAPFDDVLRNPRRSASLSRAGLLVGLTLGFDARVPMGPAEHGKRGFFTIGARLGALFGPPLGDWNLAQGAEATGAPSTGLSGAYAALAIGFGGGR